MNQTPKYIKGDTHLYAIIQYNCFRKIMWILLNKKLNRCEKWYKTDLKVYKTNKS